MLRLPTQWGCEGAGFDLNVPKCACGPRCFDGALPQTPERFSQVMFKEIWPVCAVQTFGFYRSRFLVALGRLSALGS